MVGGISELRERLAFPEEKIFVKIAKLWYVFVLLVAVVVAAGRTAASFSGRRKITD